MMIDILNMNLWDVTRYMLQPVHVWQVLMVFTGIVILFGLLLSTINRMGDGV